mmetsp:Transcript_68649/g.129480  ORF Transcript_68649/g.129480 Transcript_68649/m.129480 type:complete len:246 (+) Transcript_68649:38-775(+)
MAPERSRSDSPVRKSAAARPSQRARNAAADGLDSRRSVRISNAAEQRSRRPTSPGSPASPKSAASKRSFSSGPISGRKQSQQALPRRSQLGDADYELLMRKYRGMYSDNAGAESQVEVEQPAEEDSGSLDSNTRSSMQDFVDILLDHDNLEAAYKAIDPAGTNNVSLLDFRDACRALKFDGDVTAVFQTIDSRSQGHIGKRDFADLFKYIHEVLEKFGVKLLDRDRERERSPDSPASESFARKLL